MLRPDERQHLLELLRPPAGCKLDVAVGTTYSLDLISALMLPLSFAFFDWEHADGELVADPLALAGSIKALWGSIHDLLPERANPIAAQVSAAGHVPGTVHLRRRSARRGGRISPEGLGAALHCRRWRRSGIASSASAAT